MLKDVLEARIMANVDEISISDVVSTPADERRGYVARFAPVMGGTIEDYDEVAGVEWNDIVAEPIELTMKNKKYFADKLEDIEELKTNPMRIERFAKNQARGISRAEDSFLLAELKKGAGKTIQRTIKTPEQAYEAVVDANTELSKMDAPLEDRFIIVSYEVLGMLDKDSRFTKYQEILSNGIVQGTSINGSTLIVANTLPKDTILAVQKEGVGFERFLDKIDAHRLESYFGTGVKGLSVFDGTVIDKNHVVAVNIKGDVVEG